MDNARFARFARFYYLYFDAETSILTIVLKNSGSTGMDYRKFIEVLCIDGNRPLYVKDGNLKLITPDHMEIGIYQKVLYCGIHIFN